MIFEVFKDLRLMFLVYDCKLFTTSCRFKIFVLFGVFNLIFCC